MRADELRARYRKLQAVNASKYHEFEKNELCEIQSKAAIKIQTQWRGARVRNLHKRLTKSIKEEAKGEVESKEDEPDPSYYIEQIKAKGMKRSSKSVDELHQMLRSIERLFYLINCEETISKHKIDWVSTINQWQEGCLSGVEVKKRPEENPASKQQLHAHRTLLNRAIHGWWNYKITESNENEFDEFLESIPFEDLDNEEARWY